MANSTCIVVLGGHRCGTSAVAGVLHHLGVFMGSRFIGATQYNERGHWEDVAFVALHKRIVGGWKRPCVDFEPVKPAYAKLIRSREKQHELWGFKDPRAVYVFPFFLRMVRAEVKVVNVYRELEASANSMTHRKNPKKGSSLNVTYKQALGIARQYRDAHWLAMHYCWQGPSLAVQYEALVHDPADQVKRIAGFVGVNWSQKAIDFVSPRLKHF
jgi:hypothetical protein